MCPRATHGYMDTLGYFQMCSIADTGYIGYLGIAHTQNCTYLHMSSIADTGYCIADTGYTHTLEQSTSTRTVHVQPDTAEVRVGRAQTVNHTLVS